MSVTQYPFPATSIYLHRTPPISKRKTCAQKEFVEESCGGGARTRNLREKRGDSSDNSHKISRASDVDNLLVAVDSF
jgi:hypothetical protein